MPEAMTIAGAMFAACLLLTVFALGLLLGVFKSIPGGATEPDLETEKRIMAKLNELEGKVREMNVLLSEASTEINDKIAALTTALADVEIPAGAADELEALKVKAQALADIVSNPPPTEPPTE